MILTAVDGGGGGGGRVGVNQLKTLLANHFATAQ